MQEIVLRICLLLLPIYGAAQEKVSGDSLALSIFLKEKLINDTGQMKLQIVCRNLTSRDIQIYQILSGSDKGDNRGNIHVELQQLKDTTAYKRFSGRFWGPFPEYFLNDSLRHYDFPKKKLDPFTSDTFLLDLMEMYSYIPPVKHRVKIRLRVKTIPDLTPFTDTTGERGEMPFDEIIYLETDWIYFKVGKFLRRVRDEQGNIRNLELEAIQNKKKKKGTRL